MASDVYTFSVGEYDKSNRQLIKRIKLYVEFSSINKSQFILKALKHYEDTVLSTNDQYRKATGVSNGN